MRAHRTVRSLAVVAVMLLALLAADAGAMFMAPTGIPVDRLVANITKYAAEHPEDANARYLLGRVHALAYIHKRPIVGAFVRPNQKDDALPQVADDFMQGWVRPEGEGPRRGGGEPAKFDPLTEQQQIEHLTAAIANYTKALEMDAKPAHYHLGLAYVLDKGRELVGSVVPPKVRTTAGEPTYEQAAEAYAKLHAEGEDHLARTIVLRRYWREAAIEKYLDAYNRAAAKDADIKHQPLAGLNSLVSYEAGSSYVKLINEREASEGEKQSIASVEAHLRDLKGKPQGPVTPIVFAIDVRRPLATMLAPGRTVRFDLDGDGVAELRPWVNADTAILCWDPGHTGRIVNGKQLFGSVTFHLYPGDGYVAMDLLDDNRDGELTGDELTGLALWFDRNGDGVSDAGEVVAIERTAVAGLSVKALTRDDEGPSNPFGLRLRDGRVLPTYDWIVPAAPEADAARQ